MKKLPASSSLDRAKHRSVPEEKRQILLRLRNQARLASILLFSPWLVTVLFCRSIFADEPIIVLSLLPGLVVAVYIQRHLLRHLTINHRRLEEDRLFSTLGAANWITLVRAAGIVAIAGFLPLVIQRDSSFSSFLSWSPGIIYLGISLMDLLDGIVARKQGRETELGKRLDIETDAAGLLVASLLAVALDRLPAIYLLVGLAYYLFIIGIWMRQRRTQPVVDLQVRPYSRIIAGFQMGLVGVALLPVLNPVFVYAAAIIFMIPLLVGFLRDWLVVSCRIATDNDQLSSLDILARSKMMQILPLTLRMVILAGGVLTLVSSGVYQTHLPWQLSHSFGCLLTASGLMGRSTSLFLVLLLASSHSPFGLSIDSMIIFGSAAALMLTGSGGISLWTPEEKILYRRIRNDAMISSGSK